MKTRLQDHLNSAYIACANRLRPRSARQRIVAYVESYDDVFFWRSILSKLETEQVYFEVMLPSRTTLCRGKKAALMNQLGPALGEYMIACVDADYDWLLQGQGHTSATLCGNPYVFHTYAYAIENLQCYAPNLHTICVMSTLNDRPVADLEAFMAEYSRTVWPLFVWSVWSYKHGAFKEFSMTHFADVVGLRSVNPFRPEQTLEALRRRVNRKVSWMQQHFPQGRQSYPQLRNQLLALGLTPDTTYLYMQGHTLMENVVLPLLGPVCAVLRKEREREITQLAEHSIQRQNELASYQHSQAPIDEMLRKSTGFRSSPPYLWLTTDLARLLEQVQAHAPQGKCHCQAQGERGTSDLGGEDESIP